jgi:ABC-type sugar transport system ATPase subunit
VRIRGEILKRPTPSRASRKGVALLPEDRRHQGSIASMTIRENATLASMSKYRRGPIMSRSRERRSVQELVRRFQIKVTSIERPIRELSGGNQQKVIVSRWVDREPDVLLFDEPTQGIDVGAKREVFRIMRNLADEGCAVMFISSELEEVVEVADRVIVLREGSVAGEFTGEQINKDRILRACYGEVDVSEQSNRREQ